MLYASSKPPTPWHGSSSSPVGAPATQQDDMRGLEADEWAGWWNVGALTDDIVRPTDLGPEFEEPSLDELKAVLPTVAPEMDYKLLEGINVGTEASSAYQEAVNPETIEERREEIRVDMLRYCKHDTKAMLKLVQFFAA